MGAPLVRMARFRVSPASPAFRKRSLRPVSRSNWAMSPLSREKLSWVRTVTSWPQARAERTRSASALTIKPLLVTGRGFGHLPYAGITRIRFQGYLSAPSGHPR